MSTTASGPSPLSVERMLADGAWLRALALSLVADPHTADDLVQETWLRALSRPPRDGSSGAGWLATVLRNLARDGARRSVRRAARESAVARTQVAPAAADLVARTDAHRALLDEVVALREPFREAVLLRFFQGLPPAEIAARTGVPVATARTRVHRGLALLREALERRDPRGWQLALVPSAPLVPAGVTKATGGVIVMTVKKKVALVAALLLLLAAGLSFAPAWGARDTRGGTPHGAAAGVGAATAERRRVERGAPEVRRPPSAASAQETPTGASPDERVLPRRTLEVVLVRRGAGRRSDESDDGSGTEDEKIDAGEGGIVTQDGDGWLDPRPEGDVTLCGRVVDVAGRPLRGAALLRVYTHPDGAPVVRGGWVRFDLLGYSGPDGRFELTRVPDGRWVLQADFHGLRRATGDLTVEGAQTLVLRPGEVRDGLLFELPVDASRRGDVHVTMTGPDGRPVPGELVAAGPRSLYADLEGRAEFDDLEAGEIRVRAHPSGMRPAGRTVRVEPGRVQDVELRFEYTSTGTLELAGAVLDDAGAPVPGAVVYLGNDAETSRAQRTGDDGGFAFRRLPESMGDGPVRLWVYGDAQGRRYGSVRREVFLPSAPLEIRVVRKVELLVHLRSEGTGAPVPFHHIAVMRHVVADGESTWEPDRGAYGHEPSGDVRIHVPAGRIRLDVETKDHERVEVELDVPDVDAPYETTLTLPR